MDDDSPITQTMKSKLIEEIDSRWELKDQHTAENIAECIGNIRREYNVSRDSVLSITTDNVADYINAVKRHLQAVNVLCTVHTINLAVSKGLAVLKATALHFNKSITDSYLLESKQKLLGVKPAKLINDCATRWNSMRWCVGQPSNKLKSSRAFAVLPLKYVLLSHLQPSIGDPAALNEMKKDLGPKEAIQS
ncbi:hypothetical protein N1851_003845 [Merluccius polli]|uniref:Uncharacterized protein n=1 Tax=Merluccius polli TaxID=89951 RepID=A0AA47N7W9_MERPO|nr:hypothetical protein N1851_003845 [Merluccius polli]